jgi:ribosomal protein S18 acetylase RimI-like enzyme
VNAAYRSEGGWTHEVGVVDGQRIDAEALLADLAQPRTTVLLLRNDAGEVVASIRVDQGLEIGGQPAVYIGMLAVQPGLQDAGLGRRLLDHAEAFGRDNGAVVARISVVSIRDTLIAWYERRGYRRTGVMEGFHFDQRFGRPRIDLELAVLEKPLVG